MSPLAVAHGVGAGEQLRARRSGGGRTGGCEEALRGHRAALRAGLVLYTYRLSLSRVLRITNSPLARC